MARTRGLKEFRAALDEHMSGVKGIPREVSERSDRSLFAACLPTMIHHHPRRSCCVRCAIQLLLAEEEGEQKE